MTIDELRAKAFKAYRAEASVYHLVNYRDAGDAVPLADAEAALAECETKLQQFAVDAVEGVECLSTCDSISHDELCPVAHLSVEAWRLLREKLAECERRLGEIEEREAACCPEDVGFDEYIRALERKLAECEREKAEFAASAARTVVKQETTICEFEVQVADLERRLAEYREIARRYVEHNYTFLAALTEAGEGEK